MEQQDPRFALANPQDPGYLLAIEALVLVQKHRDPLRAWKAAEVAANLPHPMLRLSLLLTWGGAVRRISRNIAATLCIGS